MMLHLLNHLNLLLLFLCFIHLNSSELPLDQNSKLRRELSHQNIHANNISQSIWLINYPDSFKNSSLNIGKRLNKMESNESFIEKTSFIRTLNPKKARFATIDFEALYAMENFFWGMSNGLSVELGALDGSIYNPFTPSQTGDFTSFGWNRILIEANPIYRQDLIKNFPDAFSVNAAICSVKHHNMVHYISKKGPNSAAAGIVEFMNKNFIQTFYPFLMNGEEIVSNISTVTLPDDTKIIQIPCLPLQKVFDVAGVSHINFFILDVEGGEMDVLHSINWHRTTFDVLCIETETANRPDGYAHRVTHYLSQRGYTHVHEDNRNSWYRHQGLFSNQGFIPSKRPDCCPLPDTKYFPWK